MRLAPIPERIHPKKRIFVNGETGTGGGFGGLEYYDQNTERILVGNNWSSINWSVGAEANTDIPPITPIVLGDWHTMVVKNVYLPAANATVEVWLDPDFTKTEGNQPNATVSKVGWQSICGR